MVLGLKPRRSVHYCAGLALAAAPLALTTVAPAAGPADVRPPAPAPTMAAELPFGDDEPSDWTTSRSANRFGALSTTPAVAILPGTQQRSDVQLSSPKGTRVWTASAMGDHNVPAAAERAYRTAARTTARTDPSCQLPWTLLAAIGRVESDHGRYGGSVLGTDGVSRPHIIGVQLNGAGPVAAIRDTDDGTMDGDKVWDRAVGPMQFIPSTWQGAARDGDGDGEMSPNDLDDAALAAAGYLCSGYGSVLGESGMAAAIYRYNQDDYYVALVMAFERGYRTGVFIMPPPPEPEDDEKAKRKKKRDRQRDGDRVVRTASDGTDEGTQSAGDRDGTRTGDKPGDGDSTSSPEPTPKPKPKPSPTPSPSPSPTPTPTTEPEPEPEPEPELVSMSGVLTQCGASSGWCVEGRGLELGPDSQLSRQAAADYDTDGTTLTNREELHGMSDTAVELLVEMKVGAAVVYVINGEDYRYRDGSYAS